MTGYKAIMDSGRLSKNAIAASNSNVFIQLFAVFFVVVGPSAQLFYAEILGFDAGSFVLLSSLLVFTNIVVLLGPYIISIWGFNKVVRKGYVLRPLIVAMFIPTVFLLNEPVLRYSAMFLIVGLCLLNQLISTFAWFPLVRSIVHKRQMGMFFGRTRQRAGLVKNSVSIGIIVLAIDGISTSDFVIVITIMCALLTYSAVVIRRLLLDIGDNEIAKELGDPPGAREYIKALVSAENRPFFGAFFSARLLGVALLPIFLVDRIGLSPVFILTAYIALQSLVSLCSPLIGRLTDKLGEHHLLRAICLLNLVLIPPLILALDVSSDLSSLPVYMLSFSLIAIQTLTIQTVALVTSVGIFSRGIGTSGVARFCISTCIFTSGNFLKLGIGGIALLMPALPVWDGVVLDGFVAVSIFIVVLICLANWSQLERLHSKPID